MMKHAASPKRKGRASKSGKKSTGAGAGSVDAAVGLVVRRLRRHAQLTLRDLGSLSGVSSAMISRIEHGRVSPSLLTLESLAGALGVPIIMLFEQTMQTSDINFVKSGNGLHAKRLAPGHMHDYRLLGHHGNNVMDFEAARVTLRRDDNAMHPVYASQGYVFITVVDGSCRYGCGGESFELEAGDSLSFDASIPHGVKAVTSEEVTFVSVMASLI